jgi:hypothetical protein
MSARRSSRAFATGPAVAAGRLVPLEELAHYRGLAGDARLVLEAFAAEREAGALKPAQHSALLALEAALSTLPPVLVTFASAHRGPPEVILRGETPRPPGLPVSANPAAVLSSGHATGRPGT